jgi:hypothetical protein
VVLSEIVGTTLVACPGDDVFDIMLARSVLVTCRLKVPPGEAVFIAGAGAGDVQRFWKYPTDAGLGRLTTSLLM